MVQHIDRKTSWDQHVNDYKCLFNHTKQRMKDMSSLITLSLIMEKSALSALLCHKMVQYFHGY